MLTRSLTGGRKSRYWKDALRKIFRRMGYDIRRMPEDWTGLGQDPFWDMHELTVSPRQPVVFDVGANVGQTIKLFQVYFERPIIHSFEPSPEAFGELEHWSAGIVNLHLNNVALGSRHEKRTFIENTESVMSSFLEPTAITWGQVKGTRMVDVITLDDYCEERRVDRINILKSDTQGFDLEVLKGAERMIRGRAVEMVFMEINFSDIYKGQPSLDQIWCFLRDRGFELIAFYPFHYRRQRADWTDALFIHSDFVGSNSRS